MSRINVNNYKYDYEYIGEKPYKKNKCKHTFAYIFYTILLLLLGYFLFMHFQLKKMDYKTPYNCTFDEIKYHAQKLNCYKNDSHYTKYSKQFDCSDCYKQMYQSCGCYWNVIQNNTNNCNTYNKVYIYGSLTFTGFLIISFIS